GRVLGLPFVTRDPRPPAVAVLLLNRLELFADDGPAALFVPEEAADLTRALAFLFRFLPDNQDLQPGEPVNLQLEDRVGLLGIQRKPLDDLGGRVGLAFRFADDLEDLVERVEDLLEPFEDMDALFERGELVLEAIGHHFEPEIQKVPEHRMEVETLGP